MFERLLEKLKELFQLSQPELDFGIYRIMHAKSSEITQFLEHDLLPQVKNALSAYESVDRVRIDQELAEAACDELVRLSWLKEVHQPSSPAGGRSKTSYRINPKLRGGDA